MRLGWILVSIFFLVVLIQSKNILTFVGIELGVYLSFKEQDKNSNGSIEREEWAKGIFSLADSNRNNSISKSELRDFIRDYSKEFSWVNEVNEKFDLPEQLQKGTFRSASMSTPVGYYIYIPDEYFEDSKRRFRSVYYLHGGRPGNETRSVFISNFLEVMMSKNIIDPALYVFVNGGELSHYNSKETNSFGEDIFINELIPHIDKNYRTISERNARGLEGFSQGGRGATRYMFKYPELFGTVAAGGASYMMEKLIQENNGIEDDPRDNDEAIYHVGEGNDAWSLAKAHKHSGKRTPKLLLWSGKDDMNFKSIEEYSAYLDKLLLEHDFLAIEGIDHNPFLFYEKAGEELMRFHQEN